MSSPRHYIIAYPTKGKWMYGGTLEKGEKPDYPGYMIAVFRDNEWGVSAHLRCMNEIERRNYMRAYLRNR